MKMFRYLPIVSAVLCMGAFPVTAQSNPGNILGAEFQTPKTGMTQQYEQGRKEKAGWQKQQKDSWPLLVFQIESGDETGTYLVSRGLMHWADMDHPSVADAADTAEYNKAVSPYVEKLTDSYYELLPKFGNPDTSSTPSKYAEILILRVKAGKESDFRAAVGRISEAERKANPSQHLAIYELVNGGVSGTYVVSIPRDNWAGFEENPNVKPMQQVVMDAYGPDGGATTLAELDNSIESEYSEILEFRPDLSYIPGQ